MRLRVRARELRPGDVIVHDWGGRDRVDRIYRLGDEAQWQRKLASAGWQKHNRDALTLGPGRLVAVRDWPESPQRFLPMPMDPSMRLTIDREERP